MKDFSRRDKAEGYTVFDISQTQSILDERIGAVAAELDCSKDLAYAVLFKNGWDVPAASQAPFPKAVMQEQSWIASWFVSPKAVEERPKEEKVKEYIAKTFEFDIEECKARQKEELGVEQFTCEACYCDYPASEMVTMTDCGHRLCIEDFQGYCSSKLAEGSDVLFTVCPDAKCKNVVPARLFQQLLPEAE